MSNSTCNWQLEPGTTENREWPRLANKEGLETTDEPTDDGRRESDERRSVCGRGLVHAAAAVAVRISY
jgi:hypothetical protein